MVLNLSNQGLFVCIFVPKRSLQPDPYLIPTFDIHIRVSLEELDIIAKFQFPETPPWTQQTLIVKLTLSYAIKNQTDPSIYVSIHNEVKASLRGNDFIYTDGSVSDNKAAAPFIANESSIERLPNKSSIFSAELHVLYLAFDRVEMADDDERNFFILSDLKSALKAI